MATVNGYVIVDDDYTVRRLGPEPTTTTCALSTTVAPDPFLYVKAEEVDACFRWISRYREPSRLVVLELDDQGDVGWQHAAGSSLTTWMDEGWSWVPVKSFDVIDELTPSEIRAIVTANLNLDAHPPARLLEIWGL